MTSSSNHTIARRIGSAALLAALAGGAAGQADYFEAFESNGAVQAGEAGPSNLIDAGWIFRNQSSPVAGPAWYDRDGFGGEPFEGSGYLASSSNATDYFGGPVSTWAILPDIPGLQAGDTVTVWILGGGAYSQDSFFEVRYSDSGTSTGSGPSGVGDFGDMLYNVELPAATQGYHIIAFDVDDDGVIWAGSGLGLHRYDPVSGDLTTYDTTNAPLPSDDLHNVEIAPDGSVWISTFDHVFPYPGGVSQLKDGEWRVWQQPTSPLPHNQVNDLEARSLAGGGHQIWVATASEAVAVITVEGNGPAGCNPADVADPFGVLDLADVQAFIAGFSAQDPIADLNGDGVFDLADVQAFIAAFNAGCP